jgi:hypothetical protein
MLMRSSTSVLSFILLAGCSGETVILSKGGYELVQKRTDSVTHHDGNLQLWRVSNSGKRSLLWDYVVGAPEVFDGFVIFSGGLTDDRRWKIYPAVLACERDGPPVEVTEMVTRKHSMSQGGEYSAVAGAYRYRVDSATQGGVRFSGMKIPESAAQGEQSIKVTVSMEEIKNWVEKGRKAGRRKTNRGNEYFVLE